MSEYQREIQQLARAYQYRLHPFALKRLAEFLAERDAASEYRQELLKDLFALLQKQCTKDRFVDVAKVDAVINIQASKIRGAFEKEDKSLVQVVALRDVPRVHMDEITDEMRVYVGDGAENRLQALRQRYLLARRRCLRSGIYKKDLKQHLARDNLLPLLPTTALEGISADVQVAVLGLMVKRQGDIFLEDLRGHVKLALKDVTHIPSHCFFGNGFLVVVVGVWRHGVLDVCRVDLPPSERREKTLTDVNAASDLFGLAPTDPSAAVSLEKNAFQSVIIFMAHVHLDKPSTMSNLSYFFQRMQERSEQELAETTFVLVGNFMSTPISYGDASHLSNTFEGSDRLRSLLDSLGTCVATNAPAAALHSHFILVPGQNDISALQGVLPQPAITEYFAKGLRGRIKRVSLAPNPCRLRFYTHEIVVSRRDFLRVLQESERCFNWRRSERTEAEAPFTSFERIAKTIIDEAHMCPDLHTPVLWKADDALRLPVLPHTLLLCDSTEQWECYYKGVHVVNPGSFAVSTTFLWYTPADGECSVSSLGR